MPRMWLVCWKIKTIFLNWGKTATCCTMSVVCAIYCAVAFLIWLLVGWTLIQYPGLYREPLPENLWKLALDVSEFLLLAFMTSMAVRSSFRRRWWSPYLILSLLLLAFSLFWINTTMGHYQIQNFERPNNYATWYWYCDGFCYRRWSSLSMTKIFCIMIYRTRAGGAQELAASLPAALV